MKGLKELSQDAVSRVKGKGALLALAAVGAAGALAFAQPVGTAAGPEGAPAFKGGWHLGGFGGLAGKKAMFQESLAGSADALGAPAAAVAPAPMMAARGMMKAAPEADDAAAPRKIVRAATLCLEVPDAPKARALARAAALKAGAEIDSDTAEGDEENRTATLTFRVAPERLDQLMAAIEGVGRVTSRGITTQNMSEEYVDLRSRLLNAQRVEKRLNELLAFKTHKLADVLAVERELERVGREIETIEGRMKYIDHLAASSVITVTMAEPAKEPARERTGVLADVRNALVGAFNTFLGTGLALVRLTCWLAALALWVIPLSLLGWKAKSWWSSTSGA